MIGWVTTRQEALVLDRLRKLPTAAISAVLDQAGIPGAPQDLVPLSHEFRAAGPAFTIRYAPVDSAGRAVGDFLDEVPPGAVIVIDNDGRRDTTVWGGIMTEAASICGIAGTVINGVRRDVSASLARGYPLFSHGRFMRTGKDRARLVSVGEQLTISGIDIQPGAIVCADTDGVAAVSESSAGRIADAAERIEQVENQIVAAVRRKHPAAGSREVRLPPPAVEAGMTETARRPSVSTADLLPGDGDQGGRHVTGT